MSTHEALTPPDAREEAFAHLAALLDTATVGIKQVDTLVESVPLFGLKGKVLLYRLDLVISGLEQYQWLLVFQPRTAHTSSAVIYNIIDLDAHLPDHQVAAELFKRIDLDSVDLALCFSPHWESEASKAQLVEMFAPQHADDLLMGQHGCTATLQEVTFEPDDGLRAWLAQVAHWLKKKLTEEEFEQPTWVPRPA